MSLPARRRGRRSAFGAVCTAAALAALVVVAGCGDDGGSDSGTDSSGTADRVVVPDAYTSVVVEILGSPTRPVKGTDDEYHVAYDLRLMNVSPTVPATIERLEVVNAADDSDVIASYSGDGLVDDDCAYGDCNRLRLLSGGRPVDDGVIPPLEARVLFVDFAFPSRDDVPEAFLHHLYAEGEDRPGAPEPVPIDYLAAPYEIPAGDPVVLAPPLRGPGWVAINGCCEPGFPHRTATGSYNGKLTNSQRFAIDWKQLSDDGRFYEGPKPPDNEDYVDYGADILAVADATVVTVFDELEPNTPGVLPADDPEQAKNLTVETVDGNHVVLDLGDGVYAFYAHLEKGTITVEEGDRVEEGDLIAQLGNTGNANASHLHFHLMDSPSPLGSYGIPYVIDGFEYAGAVSPQRILDADDFVSGRFDQDRLAEPEPRTDELPLNLAIVDFPT